MRITKDNTKFLTQVMRGGKELAAVPNVSASSMGTSGHDVTIKFSLPLNGEKEKQLSVHTTMNELKSVIRKAEAMLEEYKKETK